MHYKSIFLSIALCCMNLLAIGQNKPTQIESRPLYIGETISFDSQVLNESRELNVYLPLNYSPDSLATYPVIYLLDGSIDEDFIHVAGIVQFGSFPWINMMPESIVIGIANVDRRRDFTFPTNNKQDKEDFPTTGGSENFIQFITDELIPLVNKRFKTNGVETIIGQSLGGLLAAEILNKSPNTFDNYVIVSPSMWWDDESFLNREWQDLSSVNAIAISVGKEGEVMERTAKELYEKLNGANQLGDRLSFKFYPNLDHGDALHLSVYDAFWMIFGHEEE